MAATAADLRLACQGKGCCLRNPPLLERPTHSVSCSNCTAAAEHGEKATSSALMQLATRPAGPACAQQRQQMLLMHTRS
jgi:hypothetical protein